MSTATPGQRGPIATETLSRRWLARLVRLGHAASVSCGCARSSLALGYYHVIPTGFHFGSLRSLEDERQN
jgi:hypothetical protein